MYKVGVIMQDKGDTAKAKAVYQQVINKYPALMARNRRRSVLTRCNAYHATRKRLFLVASCDS